MKINIDKNKKLNNNFFKQSMIKVYYNNMIKNIAEGINK